MVRLKFSIGLDYQINSPGCDFIFNIHAAQTAYQTVVSESLAISQPVQSNVYTDTVTHTRYLRFRAAGGPLTVNYQATVDIDHFTAQPGTQTMVRRRAYTMIRRAFMENGIEFAQPTVQVGGDDKGDPTAAAAALRKHQMAMEAQAAAGGA